MGRSVSNWIEGFLEYTGGLRSPDIYRRWTALCCLASACQRKVWLHLEGQDQFPNLYVLLTGPPATGKSNSIKIARDHLLVHSHGAIKLTPSDLSKRAFYDSFEGSTQTFQIEGEPVMQQCLTALVDEWAVFVPRGDEAFQAFLSDVYDNPLVRDYKTHNVGENKLQYPNLTMLGGVTTKQLKDRFTDQSLEGGFPSRCILVYSSEETTVPTGLRTTSDKSSTTHAMNEDLRRRLLGDLQQVCTLCGEFRWNPDAAREATRWVESGLEPQPKDVRLAHYAHRRASHFVKLSMLHSVAERDTLVITLDDYRKAKDVLLETETGMVQAVAGLGRNEQMEALRIAQAVVERHWLEHKKPTPEYLVRRAIADDVPFYMIQSILENLVKMQIVEQVGSSDRPLYIPASRKG